MYILKFVKNQNCSASSELLYIDSPILIEKDETIDLAWGILKLKILVERLGGSTIPLVRS